MVRKKEEMEALIVSYLQGEATPDEAMLLEDWKLENEENLRLFESYEAVRGVMKPKFKAPDVDAVWKKIQPKESKRTKVIPMRTWVTWGSGIAAVLVAGFFLWKSMIDTNLIVVPDDKIQEQATVLEAAQGVDAFTLSDQSVVKLAQGSRLELSKDFGVKERRSKLTGSANFTVIHDAKHPFVIEVAGLEVFDLGTVFDIRTLDDTVRVVVTEGSVELRLNDEVIALEAGDSAFYVISEQLISEYGTKAARKDTIFKFDGTSLEEVISVLCKFYNKDIEIKDQAIKSCPLTVEFKNKSLAEILDVIEIMLELEIVHKPSKIEIYGKGC